MVEIEQQNLASQRLNPSWVPWALNRTAKAAWVVLLAGIACVWLARFIEVPTRYASHYTVGGSGAVLLLYPLAIFATLLTALALATDGSVSHKSYKFAFLSPSVAIALPLLLVILCHFTLERRSIRFSDARFNQIVQQHRQPGVTVMKDDVLAQLGEPVHYERGFLEGAEKWSFTYTPSTGFGLRVRVIEFSGDGRMINYFRHSEP